MQQRPSGKTTYPGNGGCDNEVAAKVPNVRFMDKAFRFATILFAPRWHQAVVEKNTRMSTETERLEIRRAVQTC